MNYSHCRVKNVFFYLITVLHREKINCSTFLSPLNFELIWWVIYLDTTIMFDVKFICVIWIQMSLSPYHMVSESSNDIYSFVIVSRIYMADNKFLLCPLKMYFKDIWFLLSYNFSITICLANRALNNFYLESESRIFAC